MQHLEITNATSRSDLVAEIDRLRALNRELVKVLNTIFNSPWHKSCPVNWCDMIRTVLAKAREE
jgi:hypothetical protein